MARSSCKELQSDSALAKRDDLSFESELSFFHVRPSLVHRFGSSLATKECGRGRLCSGGTPA
jgi:hypothetical protein